MERLRALVEDRLGGHPNVGQIRGRGLLVGVEHQRSRRVLVKALARRARADVDGHRGRAGRGRRAQLAGLA